MRKLLTISLLTVLSIGLLFAQKPTYGYTHDGSTQLFSKANPNSPVNLDMNESEISIDGGFENWNSATDLTSWGENIAGASTINRDNVNQKSGTYCARLDVDASNSFVELLQTMTLAPNTQYTFEIWAKGTAGKSYAIIITNNTTTNSLHTDGSWGVNDFDDTPGDTYVKKVVNFTTESTGTSFSVGVKRGDAASASLYFDDLSLRQAHDFTIAGWMQHSTTPPAVNKRAIAIFSAGNTGILILVNATTGYLWGEVADDTNTVDLISTFAMTDDLMHFITLTGDRDGNLSLYLDGALLLASSMASIGKIVGFTTLQIGRQAAGTEWTGQIGELVVVRFTSLPSDIASWIAYAASKRDRKIPFPPLSGGGQISFWTDWSAGGYDKSGTGNHLTQTGVGGRIVVSPPIN